MRWENVKACEFCGSTLATPSFSSFVPNWYANRPLRLVRCEECELIRASPRPNARDLYKNYMRGSDKAREITMRKRERRNIDLHHRRALEKAISFAKRKVERVFDVGCGAGTLMIQARALGLEAEGNDLNRAAIEELQSMGFKAHLAFTKDLVIDKKFDVVMNLDYLEHSYTPMRDLRLNFDMLNEGGVLYLKTLYLGSPDHVADGAAWSLLGNGHFHYFLPDTLVKMIEAAGFEVVMTEMKQLALVIARKPVKG